MTNRRAFRFRYPFLC